MIEKWLSIKGYEEDYEVSNYGRVRSVTKCIVRSNNRRHTRKGKILSPGIDSRGYQRVALSNLGKAKTFKVHRLVASAFIDNPQNKAQVNHINGIKDDNRVCNLEWATHEENIKHAIENNLFDMNPSLEKRIKSINKTLKKGSLNGFSKLTEDKVKEIRLKYKPTVYTRAMLADEYGVKPATIKDVVNYKSWKHVI